MLSQSILKQSAVVSRRDLQVGNTNVTLNSKRCYNLYDLQYVVIHFVLELWDVFGDRVENDKPTLANICNICLPNERIWQCQRQSDERARERERQSRNRACETDSYPNSISINAICYCKHKMLSRLLYVSYQVTGLMAGVMTSL